MIEQGPVHVGDQTAPATIHDIRERITQAVDATVGTAFERLQIWLQMPTDSNFTSMLDADCLIRAGHVATRLSATGQNAYTPSSLALPLNIALKWEAIGNRLADGQAVVIQGASGHVCGEKSRFVDVEKNLGFHVIVFLAVGAGTDQRSFFLGFDPDVSATEQSRAAWKELVPEGIKVKELEDTVESTRIIKAMLLGDSEQGFGPLVRKYYVDVKSPFPSINRF